MASKSKRLSNVKPGTRQTGPDGTVYRMEGGVWRVDPRATARHAQRQMRAQSGVTGAAVGDISMSEAFKRAAAAGVEPVRTATTERLTPRPPHLTYEEMRTRAERLGEAAARHEAEVERLQWLLSAEQEQVVLLRKRVEALLAEAETGRRALVHCRRRVVGQVVEAGHPLLAHMLRRKWGGA